MTLGQVYFLKDHDLGIYKIGKRGLSNSNSRNRMLTEQSIFNKNKYVTNITQICVSSDLPYDEVSDLETQLHEQFKDKNVQYPIMNITLTLPNGTTYSKPSVPSGHTEWYDLDDDDITYIQSLLTNNI